MACLIFINKNAKNIDQILLNTDWSLEPIEENIYSIKVKSNRIGWIAKTYEQKEFAKKESVNLYKLQKFDGIPKILGTGISNDFSFVIMSEAPGVCLYDYMFENVFTEENIKPIVLKLLKILQNIHSEGVIHQDIKPENIMYDCKSEIITLIDFEEKCTQEFLSPEQLSGNDLTIKTDLWSLGITIYNMITKELPFKGEKEVRNKKLNYPANWSSDFKDFMNCILDKEEILRYDACDALEHPWFKI